MQIGSCFCAMVISKQLTNPDSNVKLILNPNSIQTLQLHQQQSIQNYSNITNKNQLFKRIIILIQHVRVDLKIKNRVYKNKFEVKVSKKYVF